MKSVSIAEMQQIITDYDSELKNAFIANDGPQLRCLLKRTFGIRFNDAVVKIPVSGDAYELFLELLRKLHESTETS